jgi:peptide-methionine (S)-S-oxide reductase
MKRINRPLALLGFALLFNPMQAEETPSKTNPSGDSIVLGGGCFWCIEALFETIDGVISAVSGYSGGDIQNPTYQAVCAGLTGHAEVVKIEFDPGKTSLDELLDFFWEAHDPTTLNRQGADVGTQYRSIILYNSPAQEAAAKASMKKAKDKFIVPIVTEIEPLQHFYRAEVSHQDYFKNNPNAPYCRFVIAPKLKKLES